MIEDFQNRWSLSNSEIDEFPALTEEMQEPGMHRSISNDVFFNQESAHRPVGRRMARLFGSTASGSTQLDQDNLNTPRGSVSQQGDTATHSIYSMPGTALDQYPITRSAELVPNERDSNASSSINRNPSKHLRHRSSASDLSGTSSGATSSGPDVYETPFSELPPSDIGGLGSQAVTPHTQVLEKGFNYKENESLPPTPTSGGFQSSVLSLALTTDDETCSLAIRPADDDTAGTIKRDQKRQRIVEELIETEKIFSRDMAVIRDIWLARAKGTELGEIMTALALQDWNSPPSPRADTPSIREGEVKESPLTVSRPSFDRQNTNRSISSFDTPARPMLLRHESAGSLRSMKGFTNPFAGRSLSVRPPPATPQDGDFLGGLRTPSSPGRSSVTSIARAPRPSPANGFQRPLSMATSSNGVALNAAISAADVKIIFNNVEQVAEFSASFLVILRSAVTKDVEGSQEYDKLGEAFLSAVSRGVTLHSISCLYACRYADVAS